MKLIYFLTIVFSSCNVFCSSFEDQKKIVDAQIEKRISEQIEELYDYTIQSLRKKRNTYAQVQEWIRQKDDSLYFDSREFKVILGGLYGLEKLRSLENPGRETVFQFGLLATALLSEDLFVEGFKYELNPTYPIYRKTLETIQFLYDLGLLAMDEYGIQKLGDAPKHTIERKLYEEIDPSPGLICHYFRPVIMMGEDAIFQFETFLYALSKGCVLYGLTDAQSDAHGGLFRSPLEVFVHDQSHHDWLLSVNEHCDDLTCQKTVEYLPFMAEKFYHMICVDRLFGDVSSIEYKKAMLSAFYLLHENQLKYLSPIYFGNLGQEIFKKLMVKMKARLEADLNGLNTYMRREGIPEFLYTKGLVVQNADFDIKFAYEHAMLLVSLFPVLETEIFGSIEDGIARDRTLYFNPQKTLEHLLGIMQWFYEEMTKKL